MKKIALIAVIAAMQVSVAHAQMNNNTSGAILNNTGNTNTPVASDNKNDTATPADKNEMGFSQTEIGNTTGQEFSQEKIMPDSPQNLEHDSKGMGFSQTEVGSPDGDMGFSQEKIGGNKESGINEQKGNEGHGFSQTEVGGSNQNGAGSQSEGHGFSQGGIGTENGNSGEKNGGGSSSSESGNNQSSSSEVTKNDNNGGSSDNSLEGDKNNDGGSDGSDDDKPDAEMPNPEGNDDGNPWSKDLNKGKVGEYTPADKTKGKMGTARDKMKAGEYTPADKTKIRQKSKIGEYTPPVDKKKSSIAPATAASQGVAPVIRGIQLPSGHRIGGEALSAPAVTKP